MIPLGYAIAQPSEQALVVGLVHLCRGKVGVMTGRKMGACYIMDDVIE